MLQARVIYVGFVVNRLDHSPAVLEHILVHFSVQIIIHNCFTSESGSPHKWTVKA